MTQAEKDAELLRRMREQEENEKTISCLLSRIQRVQRAMRSLDLEQEELDPKALGQAKMDVRDSNVSADLGELEAALSRRREFRSFMKAQGFPSFGG